MLGIGVLGDITSKPWGLWAQDIWQCQLCNHNRHLVQEKYPPFEIGGKKGIGVARPWAGPTGLPRPRPGPIGRIRGE